MRCELRDLVMPAPRANNEGMDLRAFLAATGLAACCPEQTFPEVEVDLSDPSPEMAELLQRCVTYAGDCESLCQAALELVVPSYDGQSWYVLECTLTVEANISGPRVHIVYDDGSVCGRAPRGLVSSGRAAMHDEITAWLAEAAHLEAASVVAFVHLALDLARLGAPHALVARAIMSAREEVAHAQILGALVAARGGRVNRPVCGPYRPASIRELALHNAVEGCAREAVGAAINAHQARHATAPEIRAAFARIAVDEARHAQLGWAIDRWARTQLTAAEAEHLDAARERALVEVAAARSTTSPAVRLALGLPA